MPFTDNPFSRRSSLNTLLADWGREPKGFILNELPLKFPSAEPTALLEPQPCALNQLLLRPLIEVVEKKHLRHCIPFLIRRIQRKLTYTGSKNGSHIPKVKNGAVQELCE